MSAIVRTNLNHLLHLFQNHIFTLPNSYPPNATIYHSIYDQSVPIRQTFAMTLTPASPEEHAPNSPLTTPQAPTNELPNWETPRKAPKRGLFPLFLSRKQNFPPDEDTEYHAPSKETGAAIGGGTAAAGIAANSSQSGGGLRGRFDNWMPAHRTYFGWSRKTFLLVIGAVFLCLLALILGLAIGLSKKHSSSSNLPLPGNKSIFTGDITYYDPGGPSGYGSCGLISLSTSAICAVSHILYDAASTSSNPNDNPLCGQKIRITRFDESVGANRSVDVKVVDRCVGCKVDDLDLSQSVFEELADVSLGRVLASWAWLD